MKIFGFIILALGVIIAYIGITGSQHQVMAIIKGVHLQGGNSGKTPTPPTKTQPNQNTHPGNSSIANQIGQNIGQTLKGVIP